MNTYSALEASIKLNISKRAVQKRCKKDNIRKKDNKYLITDLVLEGWAKEIQNNEPVREPSNSGTQNELKNVADIQKLDIEIEALKLENLSLKIKVVELEKEIRIEEEVSVSVDIEYDTQIEDLKKEIAELKEELTTYEITENERIEVFTNEEYNKFQKRLIEWRTQQKDSEHQQELFDTKILTLEQSADHYKNSYYYQRKQNERFINMHEKLLDTIQLNSKESMIKTVKDAKNTDWKK